MQNMKTAKKLDYTRDDNTLTWVRTSYYVYSMPGYHQCFKQQWNQSYAITLFCERFTFFLHSFIC